MRFYTSQVVQDFSHQQYESRYIQPDNADYFMFFYADWPLVSGSLSVMLFPGKSHSIYTNPKDPWDWYIYLHENHKNQPNVGTDLPFVPWIRYTKQGVRGISLESNLRLGKGWQGFLGWFGSSISKWKVEKVQLSEISRQFPPPKKKRLTAARLNSLSIITPKTRVSPTQGLGFRV